MSKRDLFQELMDGIGDMADQREGQITLRQYEVEAKPAPAVTAEEIEEKLSPNPILRQRF